MSDDVKKKVIAIVSAVLFAVIGYFVHGIDVKKEVCGDPVVQSAPAK